MKNFYFNLAIALTAASASCGVATAQIQRLPIQDEKPLEIFALGATSSTLGVYKLNPTDLENPTVLAIGGYIQYTGSSVGGGGTYLDAETVVGVKCSYGMYYPFEATAAGNSDGAWGHSYFNSSYNIPGNVYDMTYDEAAGEVYCWYDVSAYVKGLGKYDTTTHTITRVGSAPSTAVYALAIDAGGQLWGMGTYGTLYKIDKNSGVAEDVTNGAGSSAQFQTSMPMSAAIDPASGMMFVVGRMGAYDTYASMVKIDLNTLAVEKLGALPGYYNSLYIAGSSIDDGAPSAAENLTAAFNGSETVVVFTAPTTTHKGNPLSGELDYTIAVDGQDTMSGKANAGAEVTCALDIPDGLHEISVTFSNAKGSGKVAKISAYSGYDVPGNITNLSAKASGNEVTLEWSAPCGVNGGTPDYDKLRYKVTRGSTIISEAQEATTVTDHIDGNMKEYTYTVSVVYDQQDGDSESVSIMAGAPYDIPYSVDFSTLTSFGEAGITIIDPNTDNSVASPTWTLSKIDDVSCAVSSSTIYFSRSEFLFLPPATYSSAATYTLTFKAAASATYNPSPVNLRVLLADNPTSNEEEIKDLYTNPEDDTKHCIEVVSKLNQYDWTEYSVQFTVAEDGVFCVGIEDIAKYYETNSTVAISEISVSAAYSKPCGVTDFTAVPQTDNRRNIDLRFTLPFTDVDGNPLNSISRVDIYRGNTLIQTLSEGLVPGTVLSYTDEMAPRGYLAYHVVVYSGSTSSAPEYATVLSGYITNLKVGNVTFSDTLVPIDGQCTVTATVINDGFDTVLDYDYTVVLFCNGEPVQTVEGKRIAQDEELTYELYIPWTEDSPLKASYRVGVQINGDENSADNLSEATEISFEITVGINAVDGAAVKVSTAAGAITVSGADGLAISVYTSNGVLVDSVTNAGPSFTSSASGPGVYLVLVGNAAYKVIL